MEKLLNYEGDLSSQFKYLFNPLTLILQPHLQYQTIVPYWGFVSLTEVEIVPYKEILGL